MAGSDVQDQDITELASESLLLELTDQHLEWKFLGRHLGLTEGNLVDIERDYKGSSKEMKYQTLLKWKQEFGKRATIGKLAEALKKAGRTDLADYVMQDQRNRAAVLPPQPPNGQRNCQPPPWQANGNRIDGEDQVDNKCNVNKRLRSNIGPSVNKRLRSNIGPSVNKRLRSNIGPSDQQCQFEPQELGDELITEKEINDVAEEVYKHMGTYFTALDRFCSKFGMDGKYYNRVLVEKKSSSAQDQLFYALFHWHAQNPQTKEAIRKSLGQVHEQLGIWYVGYVNGQVNDQQ